MKQFKLEIKQKGTWKEVYVSTDKEALKKRSFELIKEGKVVKLGRKKVVDYDAILDDVMLAAQAEIADIFENNDFGEEIVFVHEVLLRTGESINSLNKYGADVEDMGSANRDYSDMCIEDVVFILEKVREYDKREK